MPQLYGNKARFNGRLLDYELVSVGSSDNNRMFGLSVSVEKEDSIGDVPLFTKRKKSLQTIPIILFKCDRLGNPLPITDLELEELSRILFSKDDIGILECNGKVMYGHFVSDSTSWRNASNQGYIQLKYELSSPYCYSPIMVNPIKVMGNKIIELSNKSTATENIFCDIEFELLSGNYIEIINMTNGKTFKLEGLTDGEKGVIYGDSNEVVSKIDSTRNLFKLSNRGFGAMSMVYGRNVFKVIGNNVRVKFIYQCEMCLV